MNDLKSQEYNQKLSPEVKRLITQSSCILMKFEMWSTGEISIDQLESFVQEYVQDDNDNQE